MNEQTRVLVQGITGAEGRFQTRQMIEYGTVVVAGVTPGRGGQLFDGIPIFNSVKDAVEATGADTSAIFVPPPFAADAIIEAAEAGLALAVCVTEGIPTLDMIPVCRYAREKKMLLVGPNTPGVISPGKCKVGVMAGYIHRRGDIGVVSRSGTLTYEVVGQLSRRGMGQSTCVGIGGDPICGLSLVDTLQMFEEDPDTRAVIMIGEIGGSQEEEGAAFCESSMAKPVVAYIAGVSAPPERRMGHAGAIVTGGRGAAMGKIEALERAGVRVARNPGEIGRTMLSLLAGRV